MICACTLPSFPEINQLTQRVINLSHLQHLSVIAYGKLKNLESSILQGASNSLVCRKG
uniref:Uncharacterized protein n=1 Tax=Trichobilharzia regenti TaxID=157069 RepID=A0AA85K3S4_TRIRE|nr:unnamed protein product [Trichobilharzia regenti]